MVPGRRCGSRSQHEHLALSWYVLLASIAMSNTHHVHATSSMKPSPDSMDLRPVPFEVNELPGFDTTDPSKVSIPTTTGGTITWRGGFEVNFPGVDEGSGRPWNDFGGWSTLVGDETGRELWTLTDNYAYLLKLDVTVDSNNGHLTDITAIENASFDIRSPVDKHRLDRVRGYPKTSDKNINLSDNKDAEPVVKRVDLESLVAIPHVESDGDNNETSTHTDSDLLSDFAVGVEDSWELPANVLIRFSHGRKKKWRDVPGADEALDVCDRNLGPEALVWLSSDDEDDSSLLVTFCETPSVNSTPGRTDTLAGFIFPIDDEDSDSENGSPIRKFDLLNVDPDCGLSDAAVTPDGLNILLLYHCYSYPSGLENQFGTGTHSTQIRVARVSEVRAVSSSETTDDKRDKVRARLLTYWSGSQNCPLTNMEGIHVVNSSSDDKSLDVILVSDNNLNVEDPTQIVRMNLVGSIDVGDKLADSLETDDARAGRKIFVESDGSDSLDDSLDSTATSTTTTGSTTAKLGSSWFGFLGKKGEKNETESDVKKENFLSSFDYSDYETNRIASVRRDTYAFSPDIETGIDFLDDAISQDEQMIGRIRGRQESFDELVKERKGILYQLRAMSMFTVAATLTMSAIVAIAALAAHSVARKAKNSGTVEELRPLGVSGGVAYPKPYGYSDEYEYDAV